jgi:transcriptional regulator with XRE-family HTH domain
VSAVPDTYYRIDPKKMKAARRAAFLTQQALSEVSGVSFNSIQRIEQGGKRTPLGQRVSTVKCLANALSIDPVDILWTSSPQGQSLGKKRGKQGGERASNGTSNPTLSDTENHLGVGVDLEPKTPSAEGKDLSPQAALNGKGKNGTPFHLADMVNLGLVVSLKDRYRRRKPWDGVTEGLLTGLVLGGKKNPAYGARAVNAAIDDLYANAGGVSNPAGYLRERAEAHAEIP